jgi:hypothetical protein
MNDSFERALRSVESSRRQLGSGFFVSTMLKWMKESQLLEYSIYYNGKCFYYRQLVFFNPEKIYNEVMNYSFERALRSVESRQHQLGSGFLSL